MRRALEPAGLVLGHRVHVKVVAEGLAGGNQEPIDTTLPHYREPLAHRGKVAALDPVTVRLDRVGASDTFRVGDLVRVAHPGRQAVAAVAVGAAHGTLTLMLLT
jgi:hypothetical protein